MSVLSLPATQTSAFRITHPARYSPEILDVIAEELDGVPGPVLDPFAGTGRIHDLGRGDTFGVEIEAEWNAGITSTFAVSVRRQNG
jgi:hypothetical protein